MGYHTINIETHGERFYNITEQVKEALNKHLSQDHPDKSSGVVHLFMPHTSCALTINEAFDYSAQEDMESLLKYLAPRNLNFIKHSSEGPDDSPSHMKSILLQQSLGLIVENKKMIIGTWQGIYLAEFRDNPHRRQILLKFISE
jgi:secondary thiamine-phosphate synthase enzyme